MVQNVKRFEVNFIKNRKNCKTVEPNRFQWKTRTTQIKSMIAENYKQSKNRNIDFEYIEIIETIK